MAANHANTVLAVGCEDGCVRLFDIADGEMAFIRSFDMQKSMSAHLQPMPYLSHQILAR
jgi:hypothetical protein